MFPTQYIQNTPHQEPYRSHRLLQKVRRGAIVAILFCTGVYTTQAHVVVPKHADPTPSIQLQSTTKQDAQAATTQPRTKAPQSSQAKRRKKVKKVAPRRSNTSQHTNNPKPHDKKTHIRTVLGVVVILVLLGASYYRIQNFKKQRKAERVQAYRTQGIAVFKNLHTSMSPQELRTFVQESLSEAQAQDFNTKEEGKDATNLMCIAEDDKYDPIVLEEVLQIPDIDLSIQDKDEWTVLHYAVSEERIEKIKLLLAYEKLNQDIFNINGIYDSYGSKDVLLRYVVEDSGNPHLVQALLTSQTIDVNKKYGEDSHTLLCGQYDEGDQQTVQALLAHTKIQVNVQQGEWNTTLLHHAVNSKDEAMVKQLLDRSDIDVNVQAKSGLTPLHYAVKRGNMAVLEALLDHPNIQPDLENDNGQKAVDTINTFGPTMHAIKALFAKHAGGQ